MRIFPLGGLRVMLSTINRRTVFHYRGKKQGNTKCSMEQHISWIIFSINHMFTPCDWSNFSASSDIGHFVFLFTVQYQESILVVKPFWDFKNVFPYKALTQLISVIFCFQSCCVCCGKGTSDTKSLNQDLLKSEASYPPSKYIEAIPQ